MAFYPSLYAPMQLKRKELNDLVPSRGPDIWAAEDHQTAMTALHARCESIQSPASSPLDRARLLAATMHAVIKHSERIAQTPNISLHTFQAADQQKKLLRTLLLNKPAFDDYFAEYHGCAAPQVDEPSLLKNQEQQDYEEQKWELSKRKREADLAEVEAKRVQSSSPDPRSSAIYASTSTSVQPVISTPSFESAAIDFPEDPSSESEVSDAIAAALIPPVAPVATLIPTATRLYLNRHLATCDERDQLRAEGMEVLQERGRGAQGVVFVARRIANGQLLALKKTSPYDDLRAWHQEREIKILAAVRGHAGLVRSIGVSNTADGVKWIHLELANGDLATNVTEAGGLSLQGVAYVVAVAQTALIGMHTRGLYHRDVKGSNILYFLDGRVVLADFGLAFAAKVEGDKAFSKVGTRTHTAPEVFKRNNKRGYLPELVDSYGLGMTAYELWKGDSSPDPKILQADIQALKQSSDPIEASFGCFLGMCLRQKDDQRLSSSGILKSSNFIDHRCSRQEFAQELSRCRSTSQPVIDQAASQQVVQTEVEKVVLQAEIPSVWAKLRSIAGLA